MKKQTSGSGQAPQWDSNGIGMGYHGILLGLGLLAHSNARMLSAGSMVSIILTGTFHEQSAIRSVVRLIKSGG